MPIPGEISLYFHIPFCTKKCDYCHFFVLPNSLENQQKFFKALKLEWDKRFHYLNSQIIKSVYFGGGTPSLLSPSYLEQILNWIPFHSDIEITIEANPENLSLDTLRTFRKMGINRLSIGAQSFEDQLLEMLGRTHDHYAIIQAVENAHKAHFTNISIDLMYDIPCQTLEMWEHTLLQTTKLPLTHVSLYNLTFEPETLFFKRRDQLLNKLPDSETSLKMYQSALDVLQSNEFIPYEISAFAKNNCYSKHNWGYWTARPFLGFGPSAYSFWDQLRFRNIPHLNKYLSFLELGQDPIDLFDPLDENARRKELLAVELRLRQGVNIQLFQQRHGALTQDTWNAVQKLKERAWLKEVNHILSLTDTGILFYDSVATDLI